MSAPRSLAGKTLGSGSLFFFAVTASSPMTVLAGGVVATYASTGVVGVPLSFVLIAVALGFLTVGYVAMARHVPHAAPGYALLAAGVGRVAGMAGAVVALLAYNAIQISLYGLVGVTIAGLAGGAWQVWAGVVWLVIAVLGVARVQANARLLAVALLAELAVIVALDVAALTAPAGGNLSLSSFTPGELFTDGVGGAFALGVAAFAGYESTTVYGEETRTPAAVTRATFTVLGFLGALYALSSWALALAVGPGQVVDAAKAQSGGLPFAILADAYDPALAQVAAMLLVTSVVAAMLSFHHGVARHLYALGRERILPAKFAALSGGAGGGAPVGGSLVQSALAAAVVTGFALAGADPMVVLFAGLSTLGAVGLLVLLVGCSWAALRYFHAGGGTQESGFVRTGGPVLGIAAGLAVLAVMVSNLESLLGAAPGSPVVWIVPAIVVAAIAGGVVWGLWLRAARPDVYAGIGRGRPAPLAQPEARLAALDI